MRSLSETSERIGDDSVVRNQYVSVRILDEIDHHHHHRQYRDGISAS